MALRPIVMSGPSGSGKSTLIKMLLSEYPEKFGFSVSHTTRKPRPGEENGREYHFVSREEFLAAVEEKQFLEHAEFSGNLYGTSKAAVGAVKDKGRVCILDIDMQGVKNVKASGMECLFIFLRPPSFEELERRLRDRKTDTEEAIQKRLMIANQELSFADEGHYDFILVNDSLDSAYKRMKEIVSQVVTL